jgi:hypothetical protein
MSALEASRDTPNTSVFSLDDYTDVFAGFGLP